MEADKKAFAALMRHLKAADPDHTVIMVQPENEVGTYNAVRDHSPTAQKLFEGPVPAQLVKALGKTPGTWSQVFGKDADEFFQAWSIGRFVDEVAAAGKREPPLPMYVNAALRDPFNHQDPYTYFVGRSPTWNVLDIWKAARARRSTPWPGHLSARERQCPQDAGAVRPSPTTPCSCPRSAATRASPAGVYDVLGRHGSASRRFGLDYTGYSNYPLGAKQVNAEALENFGVHYRLLAHMAREWARLSYTRRRLGRGRGRRPQGRDSEAGRPLDRHPSRTANGSSARSRPPGCPRPRNSPTARSPTAAS